MQRYCAEVLCRDTVQRYKAQKVLYMQKEVGAGREGGRRREKEREREREKEGGRDGEGEGEGERK